MAFLPRNPRFWLVSFWLWFALLWSFSSFSSPGPDLPPIPHFDKVTHFGYFFGGSGLLCAYLFRRNPVQPNWAVISVTAVCVVTAIGLLDEYHQTFTPGRRGNDGFDLLADGLGAAAGAWVFKKIHKWLQ